MKTILFLLIVLISCMLSTYANAQTGTQIGVVGGLDSPQDILRMLRQSNVPASAQQDSYLVSLITWMEYANLLCRVNDDDFSIYDRVQGGHGGGNGSVLGEESTAKLLADQWHRAKPPKKLVKVHRIAGRMLAAIDSMTANAVKFDRYDRAVYRNRSQGWNTLVIDRIEDTRAALWDVLNPDNVDQSIPNRNLFTK